MWGRSGEPTAWQREKRLSAFEVPRRDLPSASTCHGPAGPRPPCGAFTTPAAQGLVFRGEGTSLSSRLRMAAPDESDACIAFTTSRLCLRGVVSARHLLLADRSLISGAFADRSINEFATRGEAMALKAWCDVPRAMATGECYVGYAVYCERGLWAAEAFALAPEATESPLTLHHVVVLIRQVFEEVLVAAEHRKYEWPEHLCQTFAERAREKGLAHLAGNNPVLRSAAGAPSEPPRKALRLSAAAASTGSLPTDDSRHRRFELWLLEAEAAMRNLLACIPGSWRSVCSGISCAAAFADNDSQGGHWTWPTGKVLRYLTYFRNGGTARNYLSYLSFALQFHPTLERWDRHVVSRALCGSCKATISGTAAAFSASDTVKLGRIAAGEGDVDESLTYHLAYSYTSRMQSEIWPLRAGQPPKSNAGGWHSGIAFESTAAVIEWERRKNALGRTAIRAECVCGGLPFMQRERPCGPCALRDAHRRNDLPCDGHAPRQALLEISPSRARANLQRRAREIGIRADPPAVIGFHGFQRGRARDEHRAGTPITRILELGGWRSAAVLRYLAIRELDQVAVMNSSVDGSDSE